MAEAVRLSLNHAAICVRARSRPAAYSSPLVGDSTPAPLAGESTECAQSLSDATNPWTQGERVCLVGTRE